MKPDPTIRAVARPLRVAYLLEDGPDSHAWLNAIFADCFGRDGGRQSLIVPVANGAISKRYQDWLRVLDPDVIFAITYANDALTPELMELLADTVVLECKRKRDEPAAHPRVGLRINDSALTAVSWLPFLKARSSVFQVAPGYILDRYPAWQDDGFVTDNFGTLCGSLDPFPMHELIAMRGLMLTPANPPDNRWHIRTANFEEVPDGYAVADRIAKHGGITTLAHLSNLNCQPHRPDHPWKAGFCLVIGDSFLERVSCWNAALLFDDAHSQTYKTLRVPAATSANRGRAAQIGNLLRTRNWIGQQNGPANVVVRSSSLSADDVRNFVAWLQEASMSYVTFQPVGSIDECCPSDVARIHGAYNMMNPGPAVSEVAIRDATTFVGAPEPAQLAYCKGMHPVFSRGHWFADLSIDRLADNGRFDNERQAWRLPIRRQLVRMFHERFAARILRSRQMSVRVDIDSSTIEVKQPEDSDIFFNILCRPVQYEWPDLRHNIPQPLAYKYSAVSDKGRYLQGLLGMFGTLSNIEHTLSNHFWRSLFMSMAAPAQDSQAEVITYLKRRLKARDGRLVIDDDAGWQNLAERVIQKSRTLRVPRERTRFEKLLREWTAELSAAIETDDHLKSRREEILAEAPDDLKASLGFLFERGVFHRGHQWTCRTCSHRNWVGIETLNEKVVCVVCRHEHQLPADLALDFRLNEFFATCLREHDTLTVSWALCALREESRSCFIFAPQTELFRDYPENQGGKADRELDLVCIADGRLVVGEAKARVDLIGQADIRDLATVATELGAEMAVLAAFSGERRVLEQKVQRLRQLLPRTTEARGLVSDWGDSPSHYL